jgi:ATP-binding cassette subfamily B protein
MAAAILVVMFAQDPKTAALTIIPLPAITLLILCFGNLVGKLFNRVQESYSSMSDIVQETFAGIRVVKSFVKERWFTGKFADTIGDYQKANMALVKLFGTFFPLVAFFSGLTTLIMLLVGGAKVRSGTMTAGELAAFLSYLHMLIWPVLGLGFTVNIMQRGAASLARVNEIFAEQPSIASPEHPEKPLQAPSVPAILLKGLTFAYPASGPVPAAPASRQVLSGIDLTIPQGAVVGILGKTGSGKSTLLKILMRLIDPPPGTVFVYGKDVRALELSELRSLFAMVPQDTYLFSDSIKENMAYGASSAEDALLAQAAEISAIARDYADFAVGWDTMVGERGLTLSGGQKQRVAIARAIAAVLAASHPRILVLDDALSAVDAETEQCILTALLEQRRRLIRPGLSNPHTTLIVSHRVSTLQNADMVIVLGDGKIAEMGSPQELMGKNGFFAQTAQLQKLEEKT